MRLNVILILLCGTAFTWFSCSEENPNAGFTATFNEGDEGVGKDTITISFGKTLSEDMSISFMVGGTAALDADYTLSFPSTLSEYNSSSASTTVTAKAGTSSLTVLINVEDDSYVEPVDEYIYVLITSVSDEDVASWLNDGQYTYVIHDNDSPPTDGLQIDLSWDLGDGISIDGDNFDLYLVHNVTEDGDGNVTAYENVDEVSSANEDGFESIKIGDDLADEEYYLMIHYTEGTYDAVLTLILSYDEKYSRARGVVSTDYVGEDIFYGPITKSGTSFSRVATPKWSIDQ